MPKGTLRSITPTANKQQSSRTRSDRCHVGEDWKPGNHLVYKDLRRKLFRDGGKLATLALVSVTEQ